MAQVKDLQSQLDEKKKNERAAKSKVNMIESQYKDKLEEAAHEARQAKT